MCSTQYAMDEQSTVSHVMGVHSSPVIADAGRGRVMDQAPRGRSLPERSDALWEASVQASANVMLRLGKVVRQAMMP